MEKVIVSKEVAEAITLLCGLFENGRVLHLVAKGEEEARLYYSEDVVDAVIEIRKTEPMLLAKALVLGYEVAKTPAEMVADYYAKARVKRFNNNIALGRVQAVEFVAKAYGLKIEGVNA